MGNGKRVAIIAPPWGNSWLDIYPRLFAEAGYSISTISPDEKRIIPPDVGLHMWATNNHLIEHIPHNIMFMRRYEFFDTKQWENIDWSRIDHLIFCNTFFKQEMEAYFKESGIDVETHLVYNAADRRKWKYDVRGHGKRIGMACFVNHKKNIPMALQIMRHLPYDYELHIAGDIQDYCTAQYLVSMADKMNIRLKLHGQIRREHLDTWWEGMSYCLSTSISEGNPNNVIEAMAKGIKPIVHAWPGAEDQFDDTFSTVEEAVDQILRGAYDSEEYLAKVATTFSVRNYDYVVDLAGRCLR